MNYVMYIPEERDILRLTHPFNVYRGKINVGDFDSAKLITSDLYEIKLPVNTTICVQKINSKTHIPSKHSIEVDITPPGKKSFRMTMLFSEMNGLRFVVEKSRQAPARWMSWLSREKTK